jgi:small neutral amino acid transporter SnatA (MarC family)
MRIIPVCSSMNPGGWWQLGISRLQEFRKERRRNIIKAIVAVICILLIISGFYAIDASIPKDGRDSMELGP